MKDKKLLTVGAVVLLLGALALPACKGKTESGPATAVQFSQTLPDSIKGGNFSQSKCNVDAVNGKDTAPQTTIDVDKQQQLALTGWAADVTNGVVPPQVIIELTSSGGKKYYADAKGGHIRHDVGKAFGNPVLEKAGFDLKADISTLPADTYSLQVIRTGEGPVLACRFPKKIVIK